MVAATVGVIAGICQVTQASSAPAATATGPGTVANYTGTSQDPIAGPQGIAELPFGGGAWFTNWADDSIGRVELTPAGSTTSHFTGSGIDHPFGITLGPDGAHWFTNPGNNSIGRIDDNGNVTNYTGVGISDPLGITTGPDYALWFTNAGNNSIGRITTGGAVSNFTGSGISYPVGITSGLDGSLWFTNYSNDSIGRIAPNGNVAVYTGSGIAEPLNITSGPDGALWFTNRLSNAIGRITTTGTVSTFSDPSIDQPDGIATSPDGALWFTNAGNNSIGRITTHGVVTNFTDPSISDPTAIAAGPDGSLWFTNFAGNSIGRITSVGPTVTSVAVNGWPSAPVVDVFGTGFGSKPPSRYPLPPYCGALTNPGYDYGNSLLFSDASFPWWAGSGGQTPFNGSCIGLNISRWTDTFVQFSFGSYYNPDLELDGDELSLSIVGTLVSPSTTPQSLSISPPTGPPGTAITVTGSFEPFETVKVQYSTGLPSPSYPATVPVCVGVTASNGTFSCSGKVPSTVSAGSQGAHQVTAVGSSSALQVVNTFTTTANVIGPYDKLVADSGTGRVVDVPADGLAQFPVGSGFSEPSGVAVDAHGNVYVSDYKNGDVVEVHKDGSQTPLIIGLSNPLGVAVDANGDLYVADTGNGRILRIAPGGGAPATVGTGLSDPTGVAVDAKGDVFIADPAGKQVVEVPAGGGQQQTFCPGCFNAPAGVAVDAHGDVFVSDLGSGQGAQIVEVAPDGSTSSFGAGVLNVPWAVALDPSGNAFVADSGRNLVGEFDAPSYAPVQAYPFTGPLGVAVSAPPPTFTADTPRATASVGVGYSYAYKVSVPITEPVPTFQLASGALPPGLTLNTSTGLLSGSPTTAGSYTFQVEVENVATGTIGPPTTIKVGQGTRGHATATVVTAAARASASTPEDLSATVSSPGAGLTNPLSGTVSFDVNGTALPGCQNMALNPTPPNFDGLAVCVGTLPAGADTVTATYAGTPVFDGSTSPGVSQAVTGVAVTSSENPVSPVNQVSFTAQVTETDGGGTVSFSDGGSAVAGCQTLALDSSDTASCTVPAGAMGDHPITASYSGDATVPSATSVALVEQVFGVSSASAPPTLSGSPFTVNFDVPVTGVTTADFTAHEVGDNPDLAATVACLDASSAPVDCSTGPVSSATLTPTEPLLAGEYYFVYVDAAAGGIETNTGAAVPSTWAYVRAQTAFDAFEYPLAYKWGTIKDTSALGGSYVLEEYAGASETFKAKGSSVGIITYDAPDGGTAMVTVTNGRQPSVTQMIDAYAASPGDQTTTISGLGAGTHTVTIAVNGNHDPASSGSWVRIDGTVVGGKTNAKQMFTATTWPSNPGTDTYVGTTGASVRLDFRGTGVAWTALTGPTDGLARVVIDGVHVATEDLWAKAAADKTFTFGGLFQDGFHTLTITSLGNPDRHQGGVQISVVGLTVQ
jgi:streptogramin lyase